MKDKKEIEDIKLAKILIKKQKTKKKTKSRSIEEIIHEIPPKYKGKFKKEFKDRIPSRRDIDLFLRKYNLVKKS